ncbi:hypothetical protein DFP73DRAFT_585721 [Morchella snyderi]|nr:hypothetical protein DFP73DRAFT_585721 [Morchella snyderi]
MISPHPHPSPPPSPREAHRRRRSLCLCLCTFSRPVLARCCRGETGWRVGCGWGWGWLAGHRLRATLEPAETETRGPTSPGGAVRGFSVECRVSPTSARLLVVHASVQVDIDRQAIGEHTHPFGESVCMYCSNQPTTSQQPASNQPTNCEFNLDLDILYPASYPLLAVTSGRQLGWEWVDSPDACGSLYRVINNGNVFGNKREKRERETERE